MLLAEYFANRYSRFPQRRRVYSSGGVLVIVSGRPNDWSMRGAGAARTWPSLHAEARVSLDADDHVFESSKAARDVRIHMEKEFTSELIKEANTFWRLYLGMFTGKMSKRFLERRRQTEAQKFRIVQRLRVHRYWWGSLRGCFQIDWWPL
jgi:hypothetical protein